jgi:hypothetical protein
LRAAARPVEIIQEVRAPIFAPAPVYTAPREEIVVMSSMIGTVGPPPDFEEWLLRPINDAVVFSDHTSKLRLVMDEIHQIEEEIRNATLGTMAGFNQGGQLGFSPKWDNLNQMVAYIHRMKTELNLLYARDQQNIAQINQLIGYVLEHKTWYNWKMQQRSYWAEHQSALQIIRDLEGKL